MIPIYSLGTKYFEITTILNSNQKSFQFTLSLCYMKKFIPIEDGDYYLTPEGYRCFTEQYHLKRGYCCESGCRHCPYGFNTSTQSKTKTTTLKKK